MKKSYSKQQLLQDYGILFENLNTQLQLKTELAEYGYDDAEVAKGKTLYDEAQGQYQKNIKEKQEETSAYAAFSEKFDELIKVYRKDRKKAKIVYKEQDEVLKNLKIKGESSRRMADLLTEISVFYLTLNQDEALLTPLNRLKITEEHVSTQLTQLKDAEKAYAEYVREKGESQDATQQKELAFSAMEKWVREFYSIAKIALEDHPQLLESVAKFVRG